MQVFKFKKFSIIIFFFLIKKGRWWIIRRTSAKRFFLANFIVFRCCCFFVCCHYLVKINIYICFRQRFDFVWRSWQRYSTRRWRKLFILFFKRLSFSYFFACNLCIYIFFFSQMSSKRLFSHVSKKNIWSASLCFKLKIQI